MNKLDAILILTNQCNLNCAYCIYACDITKNKYYITISELQTTLQLMKQKLPSLTKLVLSGGDPFMHPEFIQICKEIRKIFPTIELCAYTNGLILKKFTDNELIYLTKNLHLNILSSLYPSIKNLQEYKIQNERFNRLNIPLYCQSSHFYFNKQNYKNKGNNISNEIVKNYYQNCRTITTYNNLITIYKNKILVCCGEVGFLNNNKDSNIEDLLDLFTLNNEQEIYNFCKTPHNICKDCIANNDLNNNFILWHQKTNLTQKYQESSLEEIFLNNYTDYKELFLNNKEHLICLQDKFFETKFLSDVNPGELEYLNIKYKNGLGDIFIPYTSNINQFQIEKLHQYLFNMSKIENYNLYFVGINTNFQTNQTMFKKFHISSFQDKIKGTFLQAPNLLKGYKEFINYSYLNNKVILDINEID